jgi:hypothetical protein
MLKDLNEISTEVNLEVNAQKTTHRFMSHHQTAGQNHDINTANRSYENVVKLKYLGKTGTCQNLI